MPRTVGEIRTARIVAARYASLELQYESFRREMTHRLEEKNERMHDLEEECARLRLTARSSGGAGGRAVAEAEAREAALEEKVKTLEARLVVLADQDPRSNLADVVKLCRGFGEALLRAMKSSGAARGDGEADDDFGWLDAALADRFAFVVDMPTWDRYSEDDQLAIILADDCSLAPDATNSFRRAIASTRAAMPYVRGSMGDAVAVYVVGLVREVHPLDVPLQSGLRLASRHKIDGRIEENRLERGVLARARPRPP